MQWQRVLEIYGEPSGSRGSGYLLAPRLALTARHVVEGLEQVEVRWPQADAMGLPGVLGRWTRASVRWLGPGADDLALLVPANGDDFTVPSGTVALSRLDGHAPVPVHAMGFPRAAGRPARSEALFVAATVNAWSGVPAEAMLLAVQGPNLAEREGWKGVSGAAVFAGDRLVGVLQSVPKAFDGSTLRATTAHLLLEHADAAALLAEAGVQLDPPFVDAAYVARLPVAGHWGGVREHYARAVLESMCFVDFLGLAVSGAPAVRIPALAAYGERRLRLWPEDASKAPLTGH